MSETLQQIPIPHPFFTGTDHARERAKEMDVGWIKVVRTCLDPEVTYPSDPAKHGPGRRTAVRDDIVVAYEVDTGKILTVMWRGEWSRSKGPYDSSKKA